LYADFIITYRGGKILELMFFTFCCRITACLWNVL